MGSAGPMTFRSAGLARMAPDRAGSRGGCDAADPEVRQQGIDVVGDLRVVVDVGHPRGLVHRPGGGMDVRVRPAAAVAFRLPVLRGDREAVPQVGELADALLCCPGDRPGENARLARAITRACGHSCSIASASFRSASKLSVPPSQ